MKHLLSVMLLSSLLLAVVGCRNVLEPDVRSGGYATETGDNSRVSLDWEGTYKGELPCADCEGISTEVTLEKEGRAIVRSTYLGKSSKVFTEEGRLTWDREGRTITIAGNDGSISRYLVGENRLIMLDRKGGCIIPILKLKCYNILINQKEVGTWQDQQAAKMF